MNSIGKKLPDYILSHKKVGLSIPWEKHFLEIEYFKNHIERMHFCPLFQMGNLSQIDVKRNVKDFLRGDLNSLPLFRTLFFMSLWYSVIFGEENKI
jgi:asparagine synthase (glutamine-hydrolysing)